MIEYSYLNITLCRVFTFVNRFTCIHNLTYFFLFCNHIESVVCFSQSITLEYRYLNKRSVHVHTFRVNPLGLLTCQTLLNIIWFAERDTYPSWYFLRNAVNTPLVSVSLVVTTFACIGSIRWPRDMFKSICRSATNRIVISTNDMPKPTAKRSFNFIDRSRPMMLSVCCECLCPCPLCVCAAVATSFVDATPLMVVSFSKWILCRRRSRTQMPKFDQWTRNLYVFRGKYL